jgi:type IV secretion system protein VirB6
VGSPDPIGTIDTIWDRGGAVADVLWTKGASSWNPGYFIAGGLVWCLIGLLCVYAMFLLALSNIALAILLALGPLFIALLLFETTKRFFEAWIAQLATYALITVLTVMVAALLLQIVLSYATQTAARGSGLFTVDVLHMLLIATLVFLVLRQIMPIAAGLAGGISLSSFGLISRSLGRFGRFAARTAAPVPKLAAAHALPQLGVAIRRTARVARSALGLTWGPMPR